MALPTLVKTWLYSAMNQVTAQASQLLTNQTVMLAVKNQLLAMASNPATCFYSCNSVTAGTAGDGVDRWTTATNLIWNTAASAKSWFVFKQTNVASNAQILFYLEGAVAGTTMSVYFSINAGFTGGTTTARPTATDEYLMSNAISQTYLSASNNSVRWTIQQSSDGQCTRIFFGSNAILMSWLGWEVVQNPVAGWTNPHIAYFTPTFSAALLTPSVATTNGLKTRIGTTNATFWMQCEGGTSGIGPADTVYGNAANQVSSEWPLYPLAIASGTSGVTGRHGTFFDLWAGSTTRTFGDGYPSASPGPAAQFTQIGGLVVIPWNGVARAYT